MWYKDGMAIPTVKQLRKELGLSQREMSELLGVSKKAVQSYEQGWREAPPHVEQQVLLHTIFHRRPRGSLPRCWKVNRCPSAIRTRCPAFRIKQPGFCWFITGTLCHGHPTGSWAAKRGLCLKCEVLRGMLKR